MTAEETILKIRKQMKAISTIQSMIAGELATLEKLPAEDWDWVSISRASRETGLSHSFFYKKINNGELKVKRINSKILVRMSDIVNVESI